MNRNLETRDPRLYAFCNSKVLNGMMIGMLLILFLMEFFYWSAVPAIASLLLLALMIGYVIWFWIKKPGKIIINPFLSNIVSCYALYLLIVTAIHASGRWWYIIGTAVGVWGLGMLFIQRNDSEYVIEKK